jgi:hypothetical protein
MWAMSKSPPKCVVGDSWVETPPVELSFNALVVFANLDH